MANNKEVNVKFKIYTEFDDNLMGIQASATAVKKNTGYIYIFRPHVRGEKREKDGTRVKKTIIRNPGKNESLPETILNQKTNNFFCYSLIKLSKKREKKIKKNLEKYITEKNSTKDIPNNTFIEYIPSRITYIPLSENNKNLRYLQPNGNPKQDFEWFKVAGENYAIIYLYDWITYLKKITKLYSDNLKIYSDVLDSSISVSGETYKVSSLYSFTETLKQVVELKYKYDNNLANNDREANEISDLLKNKEKYDTKYETYLHYLKQLVDPKKKEVEKAAEKIIALFSEDFKRIHSCLNDYSFGNDDEKDLVESIVGKSLYKISLFLSDKTKKIFRNEVVCNTLVANAKKLENINKNNWEAKDIVNHVGEDDWFTFAFIFGDLKRVVTDSANILETFIGIYASKKQKNLVELKIVWNYLTKGRYRKLVNKRQKIFSINEDKIHIHARRYKTNRSKKKSRKSKTKSKKLKKSNVKNSAYNKFKKQLEDAYPGCEVKKVNNQIKVYNSQFDKNKIKKSNLGKQFNNGAKNIQKSVEALGVVLDLFNIFYQSECLISAKTKDDQILAVVSLLDSLTTISTAAASSLFKESASAIKAFGLGVGMILNGIEAGLNAIDRYENDDFDASNSYIASFCSLVVGLMYLVAKAGTLPITIAIAMSLGFKLLGSYFTDDDIDIFLKYSLWGYNYQKTPTKKYSWWPESGAIQSSKNIVSSKKKSILKNKENFFHLYDYKPKNPVDFSYKQFKGKSLEYQMLALKNILERPPYKLSAHNIHELHTKFNHKQFIDLQLYNIHDIKHIESIEIKLSRGKIILFKNKFYPLIDQGHFRNGNTDLDLTTDLEKVNNFRILFIASKLQLIRKIKLYLKRAKSDPYKTFEGNINRENRENVIILKKSMNSYKGCKVECNVRYLTNIKRPIKIIKTI